MKYKITPYSYKYYLKFLETRDKKYICDILIWNSSPQGYNFWSNYCFRKPLDEEFYEAIDDLAIDQGWPLRKESPLNKKLEDFDDPELRKLFM